MGTLPLSCCLVPPGEPNRYSKTAIIVYIIDQYDKEDKPSYRDGLKQKYSRYCAWLKAFGDREKVAKLLDLIGTGRASHGLR